MSAKAWAEGFREGELYGALYKKGDQPPPNPYETQEPSMTKQIEGVPESITRQQYIDLIMSLGINPYDLYELEFGDDTITAVVKATDKNGNVYLEAPNEIAKHRISIKVVDE